MDQGPRTTDGLYHRHKDIDIVIDIKSFISMDYTGLYSLG